MKSYKEQKYTTSINVLISYGKGVFSIDSIKGLNIGHALYLAKKNWENAISIDLI